MSTEQRVGLEHTALSEGTVVIEVRIQAEIFFWELGIACSLSVLLECFFSDCMIDFITSSHLFTPPGFSKGPFRVIFFKRTKVAFHCL